MMLQFERWVDDAGIASLHIRKGREWGFIRFLEA